MLMTHSDVLLEFVCSFHHPNPMVVWKIELGINLVSTCCRCADIASSNLKSRFVLFVKLLKIYGFVFFVVLLVVEGNFFFGQVGDYSSPIEKMRIVIIFRYKEGHAITHWKETRHCYSLELETQRVWDYSGDNYAHRLIQSKTDGKLVELNHHCAHVEDGCGSCNCSVDPGFSENQKIASTFFHIII